MDVGVYEAKTHFAELVARATRGERITITKHGKPVAELRRPAGLPDRPSLNEAWAKLEARRKIRPANRKPLTTDEILAAKNAGRR